MNARFKNSYIPKSYSDILKLILYKCLLLSLTADQSCGEILENILNKTGQIFYL